MQDEVPELSDEGDNARKEDASQHSLLGVVNTLTAGLDDVKADNKNLRALIKKKMAADGTSLSAVTCSH